MIHGFEPKDRVAALAATRREELWRLPQPLHLLEFVGDTQHYHFGFFEGPDESLRCAQDRMSLVVARHFAPGSAVLDIGCGLGGTSRLLASQGLRVTAIDPCGEGLAYARGRGSLGRGAPRFLRRTLEQHARAGEAAADGALALEVLQHFPDLLRFFSVCRGLLRPGATLVVHDLWTRIEVEWSRVYYHLRGRALAAAEASGFRLLEHRDLSDVVRPTLPATARALAEKGGELRCAFGDGPGGRPVDAELAQLLTHMQALQRALELGDLAYEALVFRAESARSTFPCA